MIRSLVEDYYDMQKMRIELENQLRSLAQGVSKQEEKFVKEKIFDRLHLIEKSIATYLNKKLKDEDIWKYWLKDVRGIGNVLAAGLVSWIGDIEPRIETITIKQGEHKGETKEVEKGFKTISKLWRYAGYAVNGDGFAEKRKAGEVLHFNPRLKTHLWKVGESFVKTGDGYRKLYEQFRNDYDEKWLTPEICGSKGCKNKGNGKCMDGHRYEAAKRKTVKVFLAHYMMKARELKGLSIEHPFIIGRNGHGHEIPIIER